MRHIPTTLYIDTELFVGQQLRFDTSVFKSLKDSFVSKGLRLLIPAVTEREIQRHFMRRAEKVAQAIHKADKIYPIERLGFQKILPKDELISTCIDEMNVQWTSFKDFFVVKELPIVGNIEKVIDWYFEVKAPFGTNKKEKEFPDAFIISILDLYHEKTQSNIAVIGKDGDFCVACSSRHYIAYYEKLEDYISAFKEHSSGDKILPDEIDLTKPIVTEDLTELKSILARGIDATPIERKRVMKLLKSRGENYTYFFMNVNDTIWMQYLIDEEYFSPPESKDYSLRLPLEYLLRIFDTLPTEVIQIVSKLPLTTHCYTLNSIFEIILKSNSADVTSDLVKFIIQFIKCCSWNYELIIEFLNKEYIFDSKLSEATPAIILKLIEFKEDPDTKEKRAQRAENPEAPNSSLNPTTRFNNWEYQQILEKGISPLAEKESYQVARILIDATSSMIRMNSHQDEMRQHEDFSEIWCRRLNKPDRDYQNSKETLIHTLTFACEKVYENTPESIEALDLALRNQHWNLFSRLRQHLYALYPTDQTLPWIRELVINYRDYSRWTYSYEFQQMVRNACEAFGPQLLSKEEQIIIFEEILKGPLKEEFYDDDEEILKQKQVYFHCKQFYPFAKLLHGQYKFYFEDINCEDNEITDESYSPYKFKSGTVTYKSPKSLEEIYSLDDLALLTYLNEWNEEHRDENDWLIKINISALSDVFQEFFAKHIVFDEQRLSFWLKNKDKIERPIYITSMLKALKDLILDNQLNDLDLWFEFCAWVTMKQDTRRIVGGPDPSEESSHNPDWSRARRAVIDFINACFAKEANINITARNNIAKILKQLCTQFDWRLDQDLPVLLNRDDQVTEAINCNRSKAIESLINFGFWIRRSTPDEHVNEISEILSSRFDENSDMPLTRPEYALLGMHIGNLLILDSDFTTKHKDNIFLQSQYDIWNDAFSSYIRFANPQMDVFELLHHDFEYALDNIHLFIDKNNDGELVCRLGQHVFTYYLWKAYDLMDENSLLILFYDKTNSKREYWGQLFDYIGRSLNNSGKDLDKYLIERVTEFFEWRLEVGEPNEIKNFTFWLDAECLDEQWRLKSFSKILDHELPDFEGATFVASSLNKLLLNNTELVVECFAKITDMIGKGLPIYVSKKDVEPILKAGLSSSNQNVQDNAIWAKENLLRDQRFDILDIN